MIDQPIDAGQTDTTVATFAFWAAGAPAEVTNRLGAGQKFNAYNLTGGGYVVSLGPVTDALSLVFTPEAGIANLIVAALRQCAGQEPASAPVISDDDLDLCGVCAEPLQPADLCHTDVDLGTCHAECLAGSPVVDLDTGAEIDVVPTPFRYDSLAQPRPKGGS